MCESLNSECGEGAGEAFVKVGGGEVDLHGAATTSSFDSIGTGGGRAFVEFAQLSSTIKSSRQWAAEGRSRSGTLACG